MKTTVKAKFRYAIQLARAREMVRELVCYQLAICIAQWNFSYKALCSSLAARELVADLVFDLSQTSSNLVADRFAAGL